MIMAARKPLVRSFKDLVQRHVAEDPAYAEALLREGIDAMLGDVEVLRDRVVQFSCAQSVQAIGLMPSKARWVLPNSS